MTLRRLLYLPVLLLALVGPAPSEAAGAPLPAAPQSGLIEASDLVTPSPFVAGATRTRAVYRTSQEAGPGRLAPAQRTGGLALRDWDVAASLAARALSARDASVQVSIDLARARTGHRGTRSTALPPPLHG